MISVEVPETCKEPLDYITLYQFGEAAQVIPAMRRVCGVNPPRATRNDVIRYMMCTGLAGKDCIEAGLKFPPTCSVPPCNQCLTGTYYYS